MKKTEMMKRYEAETGEILDIDHLSADANGSWYGYIEELEAELRGLRMLNKWSKEEIIQYQAKATAYDRLMTLNEAITHCKENVQKETQNGNLQCAIEHNQLAMWLSQLEEAKAKAAAYDRLIEKLSLWGKHLKSASMTQNSLDFVYCAQQVMDEITLTMPDGWEE